jgi:hypothetical protein
VELAQVSGRAMFSDLRLLLQRDAANDPDTMEQRYRAWSGISSLFRRVYEGSGPRAVAQWQCLLSRQSPVASRHRGAAWSRADRRFPLRRTCGWLNPSQASFTP